MTTLAGHPQRNSLRLQLRQNTVLQGVWALLLAWRSFFHRSGDFAEEL